MRRWVSLGLAVLILIALAVFLNDDIPRAVEDMPDAESPTADPIAPTLKAPSRAAPTTTNRVQPPRKAALPSREREKIPTMSPGDVTIRGRIVLVEEGIERVPQKGTVHLLAAADGPLRGESGDYLRAKVRDGSFQFAAREGAGIRVRSMTLDGRIAIEADAQAKTRHTVTSDEVLHVRARRIQRTLLRVVSAETGLDLGGVDVILGKGLKSAGRHHPGVYGQEKLAVRGARSPVELPQPTRADVANGFQRMYVRASGHAWQQVRTDVARGGLQTVELPAGGSLRVRLASAGKWDERCVKVASDISERMSVINLRIGEARELLIESLPVGERKVWIAAGGRTTYAQPTIASATVTIRASDTAEAYFDVPVRDRTATAPLRGTLELARAWGRRPSNLSIYVARVDLATRTQESGRKIDIESTASDDEARQTFTWDAGLVLPGTFKLHIARLPWATLIEVPEHGATADLVVPDPVYVTLRLRSEDGGPLPELPYVLWRPVGPTTQLGGDVYRAKPGLEPGSYRLLAPVGTIRLSTPGQGVLIPNGDLEVSRSAEHEVVVRRESGFVVVLMDGDRVVRWDGGWFDFETSEKHGLHCTRVSTGTEMRGMQISVAKPGRYKVYLRTIPGYVQPGVHSVDVEQGRFVDLIVPLKRER